MATFTATPESSGNLNLVLHHNFVTDSRDSLTTTDTGRWFPCPGCQVFSACRELHDHWRYGAICKCDGIPSEPRVKRI